jgi:hypothetical protein
MSRPKWTKKTPTTQGWYWYRHENGDVWIEDVRWKQHTIRVKRLAAMGTAGHYFVHTYGGEWAGPIEEPVA